MKYVKQRSILSVTCEKELAGFFIYCFGGFFAMQKWQKRTTVSEQEGHAGQQRAV